MRINVPVYKEGDTSYVYIDDIDPVYRETIADLAMRRLEIFEVNGKHACPFEIVLECSAGNVLS